MCVYRLAEPIDAFDGLNPLHEWLASQPPPALNGTREVIERAATLGCYFSVMQP